MTRWLRVALALQLVFFAGWGARLLTSHRDVAIVWLATEPVDPRDLLSGHYVALRYAIATAATRGCEELRGDAAGTPVWIQLAPAGEPVATAAGEVVVSDATGCTTTLPVLDRETLWIAGTLDVGGRVVYGIERMFVPEDDPRREARSGTVVAKVALNESFEPRLLDLVPKEGPPR